MSVFGVLALTLGCSAQTSRSSQLTPPHLTIDQVIESRHDLWGELALKQPGGPTYEFFASLLPPLRYVETDFRCYPIVLSSPGAEVKARLISDGRGINLLARQPNWRTEEGTPAHILVGRNREPFGQDLSRLTGPTYADGYLPIVQLQYRQEDGATYSQESFAATDPELAQHGAVFVKLTMLQGQRGKAEIRFEGTEYDEITGCVLKDPAGKVLAVAGPQWEYNKFRNTLASPMEAGESATALILTRPAEQLALTCVDAETFRVARDQAASTWRNLVAGGMQIRVPESYVNNAWRSLIVGNYALLKGDEMNYSAGNQYAKQYVGEGTDTIRCMMMYGQMDRARRMMLPLFIYTRKGLEFHQAAFKLQMLAHYYRLSGDGETLRELQPRWEKELNILLTGRETSSGMLPREKYCGDIDTRVYSLNSNANGWRAVRDMAQVLEGMGDARADEAARYAEDWRRVILENLDKAIRRDVDPPFVPIALSGEETPYERITESRMSGYWNLMIGYVMASGVFRPDSEAATGVIRYLQERGGVCMGMIRSRPADSFWIEQDNVNDLYGMRYSLLLLQRDEVDRMLVGFYGKLAQGLSKDTFICGEGSCIRPLDEFGRQFYLPPNSAGNSNFLQQLRYMLVQDYDVDDDGQAETLRLLFATPRGWLGDGKEIAVERAPTALGEVSVVARSKLKEGRVEVDVESPSRGVGKMFVRLRMPDGYKVVSAYAGAKELAVSEGETIDLSGLKGRVALVAKVSR